MNIWDELSKVYNMPGIPDEAMSIIGDAMLAWSESQGKQPEQRSFSCGHEDDLISRRDALDSVNELRKSPWFNNPQNLYRSEAVDIVERFCIKELPSAQRWIPCSERLPDEKDAGILKKLGTEKRSEYVLATVEVKGERMTVTACAYDGKWDWKMKYAFPDFKVVAWKPMPEPYREEGE